jgi:hypothetical protein
MDASRTEATPVRLVSSRRRKDPRSFFNIALGVELTHVSRQVFDLLIILNAGKDHLVPGTFTAGFFI